MKHSMQLIAATLVLSAAVARTPGMAESAPQGAINAVIAEFMNAIRSKNKDQFLSLFLDPGHTSWQAVNGDAVAEKKRATTADTVKARINPNANPTAFIEGLASKSATTEETFSNVSIEGDADVAAVSFDYSFKIDRRVTNTGTEHWLLVRTDQGWRITSVNWSIETYMP